MIRRDGVDLQSLSPGDVSLLLAMSVSNDDKEISPTDRRAGHTRVSVLNGSRPPRTAKAAHQIIESIRVAIAAGRLARGDRLPTERDLAKEFGVSQPTIREAVRVLEAMGLIEVRHGSGAYVAANSQDFVSRALQTVTQMENVGILDVIDLRLCLAPYSAARAAKRATPENLAVIEALDRRLVETAATGDFDEAAPAMLALLAAVSAASHHPLLFSLESYLTELTVAFFVAAWRQDPENFMRHWRDWSEPIEEHRRRLLKALRMGDDTAAADAMSAHIEYQARVLQSFPQLTNATIADPAVARALAEEALEIPLYHDLQSSAKHQELGTA